jgi:hypothetical protein
MSNHAPPPPPGQLGSPAGLSRQTIGDMRNRFARRTPQTAEDLAAAQAFIDGKIEMVRGDTHMTDAEKAAAIADLESRKSEPLKKP